MLELALFVAFESEIMASRESGCVVLYLLTVLRTGSMLQFLKTVLVLVHVHVHVHVRKRKPRNGNLCDCRTTLNT